MGVWHSLLALMQIGSQFLHPNALLDAMGALIENGSAHGSLVGLLCVCVCVCVCVFMLCVCVCVCVCVSLCCVCVCACVCVFMLQV